MHRLISVFVLLALACDALAQGPLFVPTKYPVRASGGVSYSNELFVVTCGSTNKVATGTDLVVTNWTMLVASNVAAAAVHVNASFYRVGNTSVDTGVSMKVSDGTTTNTLSLVYATNYASAYGFGVWKGPIGNLASNMLTITVSNNNSFDGFVASSAVFHNCNQTNTPTQFETNYATLDGTLSASLVSRTNDYVIASYFTAAWDELSVPAWTFNSGSFPEILAWATNSTLQMEALSASNHMNYATASLIEQDAVPANPTWVFISRADYLTNAATVPPIMIASDNFDSYANGSDLAASANWVGVLVAEMFVYKPASDGAVYSTSAQPACYHVASFSPNHRSVATCKVITPNSFNFISVQCRVQSGADTRYFFQTDGRNWYLVDRIAGSQNVIASGTHAADLSNGDRIRLDATGVGSATRLTAAVFTGGSWANVSGAANIDPGASHYIDGGSPGVGADNGLTTTSLLDDWEGWNL